MVSQPFLIVPDALTPLPHEEEASAGVEMLGGFREEAKNNRPACVVRGMRRDNVEFLSSDDGKERTRANFRVPDAVCPHVVPGELHRTMIDISHDDLPSRRCAGGGNADGAPTASQVQDAVRWRDVERFDQQRGPWIESVRRENATVRFES